MDQKVNLQKKIVCDGCWNLCESCIIYELNGKKVHLNTSKNVHTPIRKV